MVGATVAVAVSVEEAAQAGKFQDFILNLQEKYETRLNALCKKACFFFAQEIPPEYPMQ